jgi:hypothetical protein
MDVVRGGFNFDIRTGKPVDAVASRSYLDPEIAGEGEAVDPNIAWVEPPPKPVIPDISQVKTIRKYFGRPPGAGGMWPAWLYHATEKARILPTPEDARKLGVVRRKASEDEKLQFGAAEWLWDWVRPDHPIEALRGPDQGWRPAPLREMKHDPRKLDIHNLPHSKNYVPTAPNPAIAQNAMIAELVPTVAAAVASALKSEKGIEKPAHIDEKEWDEFLAFQAFKKTTQVVEKTTGPLSAKPAKAAETADEKELWLEAAEQRGVKIDKRWSLERLKKEVMAKDDQIQNIPSESDEAA